MKGLVKKQAILEYTKSHKIKYWLREFTKVVPCVVQFNAYDLASPNINVEIKLSSPVHSFTINVPKRHVYVQHKTIKNSIPLHMWEEAENFSNLRRIARREEAVYDGEWPDSKLEGEFKPVGNNPKAVLEICWDKGVYQCDFCFRGQPTNESLTLDHQIPRSWKHSYRQEILDDIEHVKMDNRKNYQVLCLKCHRTKTEFEGVLLSDSLTTKEPYSVAEEMLWYCRDLINAKAEAKAQGFTSI